MRDETPEEVAASAHRILVASGMAGARPPADVLAMIARRIVAEAWHGHPPDEAEPSTSN